jgi:hypothetical protein
MTSESFVFINQMRYRNIPLKSGNYFAFIPDHNQQDLLKI